MTSKKSPLLENFLNKKAFFSKEKRENSYENILKTLKCRRTNPKKNKASQNQLLCNNFWGDFVFCIIYDHAQSRFWPIFYNSKLIFMRQKHLSLQFRVAFCFGIPSAKFPRIKIRHQILEFLCPSHFEFAHSDPISDFLAILLRSSPSFKVRPYTCYAASRTNVIRKSELSSKLIWISENSLFEDENRAIN